MTTPLPARPGACVVLLAARACRLLLDAATCRAAGHDGRWQPTQTGQACVCTRCRRVIARYAPPDP